MSDRVICAAVIAAVLQVSQAPFRSGVDVVEVDVSVMRGGKAVTGLTAANFVLTDNGVAQEVATATLDRLPLSVFVVLDISSSVAGDRLASLIDGGQMLVRALRPGDRAALVTFSESVRVDVPLTSDTAAIARALAGLRGSGATSLNDAVHVALQLRPLDTSRPLVILFSDGVDNRSWLTGTQIEDEVRRAGVVIHAIELRDKPDIRPSFDVLPPTIRTPAGSAMMRPLTAASGGRIWPAGSPRDLRALFTQALEEMRARYLLTYTPKETSLQGRHALKVSLKNARGTVTARPAYVVSPSGED